MRSRQMLRRSRPAQLGVGALMLAIPASAVALNAGQADIQGAIPITLSPHRLAFGHEVTVSGKLSPGEAGQSLQLQFAPATGVGWRSVAATRVRGDGSFQFVSPVKHSGLMRVERFAVATAPRSRAAECRRRQLTEHVAAGVGFGEVPGPPAGG